jgi:hypothetical protein
MHQEDMRPARNIWMDGHWEDELIILAIIVVKVVLQAVSAVFRHDIVGVSMSHLPDIFNISWIYPSMGVG